MQRLTLREAAERTSRSITTLRRYIRSGRLHAEKRYGRFGPEYYVAADDLSEAGLDVELESDRGRALPELRSNTASAPPAVSGEGVPISLYQELQMKHEQLLVQYGMIRAGGLKAMELQQQAESRQETLDVAEREILELRQQLESRDGGLRSELSEARLELEGKSLEIAALKSKVRALEMLTRNAVTNETIENQFLELVQQERRVDQLGRDQVTPTEGPAIGETHRSEVRQSETQHPGIQRPGVHAVGEPIEPDH